MKRKMYRNKWFILVVVITLFFMATWTKAVFAGTDVQLDKILKAGIDGLSVLSNDFFKFLIDVLTLIWA